MYPPLHLGGYEVIWKGYVDHLRALGHEVRVLTTGYGLSAAEGNSGESGQPHVRRELDWYWREHRWRELSLRQQLALERRNAALFDFHVSEFRPDAVTWWPMGGMSLGLIERARRRGLESIFFVLDPWMVYGPRHDLWTRTGRKLGVLRGLVERVTGLPFAGGAEAGTWVFCSEAMRRDAATGGLRPERSVTLAPGVAEELLGATSESTPPPWGWRLLYLGRVVPQKGVDTVIQALSSLPPQATLQIVGEGDQGYRDELARLVARSGLDDRVRFSGPCRRDELAAAYRQADVTVFPVRWAEPYGLVPLESMALGRPVVATGKGGSGDYLRDELNALLFPAEDHRALAAAIKRLAGDEGLRERLRAEGRRTAESHSEAAFNRRAAELTSRVAERALQCSR